MKFYLVLLGVVHIVLISILVNSFNLTCAVQKDNIVFIYCFECFPTAVWIPINLLKTCVKVFHIPDSDSGGYFLVFHKYSILLSEGLA